MTFVSAPKSHAYFSTMLCLEQKTERTMNGNRGHIQKAAVIAMLAIVRAQQAAKRTLEDMRRATRAVEDRMRPRTTSKRN